MLLHEPGHYPVAYFPLSAVTGGVLEPAEHTTRHRDFGPTSWYTVRAGTGSTPRAAWQMSMAAMTPVRPIGLPRPGHSVHGQPSLAQAWQFNRCDDEATRVADPTDLARDAVWLWA